MQASLFCNTEIDGGHVFSHVHPSCLDQPSDKEAPDTSEEKAPVSSNASYLSRLPGSASQVRLNPRGIRLAAHGKLEGGMTLVVQLNHRTRSSTSEQRLHAWSLQI